MVESQVDTSGGDFKPGSGPGDYGSDYADFKPGPGSGPGKSLQIILKVYDQTNNKCLIYKVRESSQFWSFI